MIAARLLPVSFLLILSACVPSPPESAALKCQQIPEPLSITEFLADPEGSDDGAEWIELYNNSPSTLDLSGVVLEISSVQDGPGSPDSTRLILERDANIEAFSYAVLTGATASSKEAASWRNLSHLVLPNTGGHLRLLCGDQAFAHVSYGASAQAPVAPSGASVSLDGGQQQQPPLPIESASWCSAVPTPGSANGSCGSVTCWDSAQNNIRLPYPPESHDLVLSEVLANPAGTDKGQEWIEVLNISDHPIDINGLELEQFGERVTNLWDLHANHCVTVDAAGYALISLNSTEGSVFANLRGSDLLNDATLFRLHIGTTVLDEVSLPASNSGISLQRAAIFGAPEQLGENWCEAPSAERTTPGRVNWPCTPLCLDDMGYRPRYSPGAGDLLISEIYADPTSPSADGARDWVELYVNGEQTVDLAGLELVNTNPRGSVRRWQLNDNDACLRAEPGTWLLLTGANAQKDGTPRAWIFGSSPDTLFYNEAANLSVRISDILVDSVDYPAPIPGSSWQAAEASFPERQWCKATVAQAGFAGTGTPGARNVLCP